MQVRDVMTQATITESPQDSLRSAAERMWRQQTGSLLVADNDNLIGIITERDLLRAVALGADPDKTSVDDAMTVEVEVSPGMGLSTTERDHKAAAVAGHIKSLIGVSAVIDTVEPGGVERSLGKAKRIIDRRPKEA